MEELSKKAGAAIKNQGIMRGWSAWQAKWEEQVAHRQMLASAALAAPSEARGVDGGVAEGLGDTVNATGIWKRSEMAEDTNELRAVKLKAEQKELAEQRYERETLEKQLLAAAVEAKKKRRRRTCRNCSAGRPTPRRRLRRGAEQEKQRRIEQLTKKAGARIKNQGIMAILWHALYEEQVAQRQMLAWEPARGCCDRSSPRASRIGRRTGKWRWRGRGRRATSSFWPNRRR